MLYICIPAYNEAQTVGVLLWRIRKVFQEYSREYEVLVYDDGSTDGTAETLEPYRDVMPLTVLGGREHLGYDRALDALARAVSARTRYPRRDAMITLQADFTDQPEHLPELIKRFEGGADLSSPNATLSPTQPAPVRRLRWIASWAMRAAGAVPGVADPFGALRLYRITLIRDLIKEAATRRSCTARAGPPTSTCCAAPRRWRVAWRRWRWSRATTSAPGRRASVRGPTASRSSASGRAPRPRKAGP